MALGGAATAEAQIRNQEMLPTYDGADRYFDVGALSPADVAGIMVFLGTPVQVIAQSARLSDDNPLREARLRDEWADWARTSATRIAPGSVGFRLTNVGVGAFGLDYIAEPQGFVISVPQRFTIDVGEENSARMDVYMYYPVVVQWSEHRHFGGGVAFNYSPPSAFFANETVPQSTSLWGGVEIFISIEDDQRAEDFYDLATSDRLSMSVDCDITGVVSFTRQSDFLAGRFGQPRAYCAVGDLRIRLNNGEIIYELHRSEGYILIDGEQVFQPPTGAEVTYPSDLVRIHSDVRVPPCLSGFNFMIPDIGQLVGATTFEDNDTNAITLNERMLLCHDNPLDEQPLYFNWHISP